MTYSALEAREHLLEQIADAGARLEVALAYLGEAHEQLDEHAAEGLEEALFRPVQKAYALAKRNSGEFAERHGLPLPALGTEPSRVLPGTPKSAIDHALEAIGEADGILSALQDSMLPVEVGDPQLRAGLAQVRRLLGDLRGQARQIVRTLGR